MREDAWADLGPPRRGVGDNDTIFKPDRQCGSTCMTPVFTAGERWMEVVLPTTAAGTPTTD